MSDQVVARAAGICIDSRAPLEVPVLTGGFAEFYAAAFPRVYAFVRSQVGNRDTAQEIVGRTFLKAYRHRDKAPGGDRSIVWVFRIAYTVLIDYRRVEGRRDAVSVSIEELSEFADRIADPEAAYASRERHALLLRMMSELDEDDRTILAFRFAAQRTNREIGEILQISEAAVSMRLLRALRRLRKRLAERGISS
jgi:RNA polymerase sigma-70 factor (ECF subfamily)